MITAKIIFNLTEERAIRVKFFTDLDFGIYAYNIFDPDLKKISNEADWTPLSGRPDMFAFGVLNSKKLTDAQCNFLTDLLHGQYKEEISDFKIENMA